MVGSVEEIFGKKPEAAGGLGGIGSEPHVELLGLAPGDPFLPSSSVPVPRRLGQRIDVVLVNSLYMCRKTSGTSSVCHDCVEDSQSSRWLLLSSREPASANVFSVPGM